MAWPCTACGVSNVVALLPLHTAQAYEHALLWSGLEFHFLASFPDIKHSIWGIRTRTLKYTALTRSAMVEGSSTSSCETIVGIRPLVAVATNEFTYADHTSNQQSRAVCVTSTSNGLPWTTVLCNPRQEQQSRQNCARQKAYSKMAPRRQSTDETATCATERRGIYRRYRV